MYPRVHGGEWSCRLLAHVKERTRCRRGVQCVAVWAGSPDGRGITLCGNRIGRAMNVPGHDALAHLHVDTGDILRLSGMLIGCDENVMQRWAEEEERRGGDDGMWRKRHDFGFQSVFLEVLVESF